MTTERFPSLERTARPNGRDVIVQFSLRTMLLFMTFLSAVLAITVWNTVIGVSASLATIGLFLICIGVRTRRRVVGILGGSLMLIAIGYFACQAGTATKWCGRQELDVVVLVVDGSSLARISDARVEVLHGPSSPLEGPHPDVNRAFSVIEVAPSQTYVTTNERGETSFKHEFFAYGSINAFEDIGYVRLAGVWLRVTASGYQSTILPVDGQSVRPRNIRDKTPVVVTVPLGKAGAGKTAEARSMVE